MRRFSLTLILAVFAIGSFCSLQPAWGQGCIVARSNGEVGGPQSEGGYLAPGEINFAIDYRHQFSFRHFIGPTEQTQRLALGTEVMNKINLENVVVTYQMTPRFSVTASMPVLSASRRSNNSPYTNTTAGIGDTSFMVSGWLWNPQENKRGNVQFGIGLSLPTGRDNLTNMVDKFDGKGLVSSLPDYSIQPGSGGYGIAFQWVAYKNVRHEQLYFNGSYLATPQDVNNVLRSTSTNAATLTQYASISDQYLLEAGIAHPISKIRGLTLTLGPRMEGVPAHDLIGDALGFRRPGFAISLEPGFQYAHNGSAFTFQFGKALYRDRTRSEADIITGGHGDAAFADWVWLASYSYRIPTRHKEAHPHTDRDPLMTAASATH
jgi:hypothetical protein